MMEFCNQAEEILEKALLEYIGKNGCLPNQIRLSPRNWMMAYKQIEKDDRTKQHLYFFGVSITYGREVDDRSIVLLGWGNEKAFQKDIGF